MIKFLWYCYFGLYVAVNSLSAIKVNYLRKFHPEKADQYAYHIFKRMCAHIIKRSKTDLQVFGEENIPKGAAAFVGNHEAIFDAFAVIPVLHNITGFIAKKEIEKLPLVGWWMKQVHSVFIDRADVKEGIKAINEGAENLKNGYSMVIFPEGTRSLESKMGEFKKGSLKLALKSGAPIVPFTVDGTYNVLEVGNKVRGNKVKIMFHPPIYTENLSREEQKDITERVYAIIGDGLNILKEK